MTIQQILQELPNLSQEDLRTLKDRIGFLLTVTDHVVHDEWLIVGIQAELVRRGLSKSKLADLDRLQQVLGRAPLRAVENTATLLLDRVKRPLKPAERLALGQVAARALAYYLTPRVPLSLKTMVQNIDKVPTALEQAFPGYMQAGMLGLLVQRKVPNVADNTPDSYPEGFMRDDGSIHHND